MNINERVVAVLSGEKPDRIPFICRLDFWFRGLTHQGNLPVNYVGISLPEIHQSVGLGQEDWLSPFAHKYLNLELVIYFDGKKIHHEYEPEICFFPDLWGLIPVDQPGEVVTELITPAGKLVCSHRILDENIRSGITRPQMIHHPISDPDHFRIYEYIIEHTELVPRFEAFLAKAEEMGDSGFLVPTLNRVPFQSILIDVMGEINCFYALYDTPDQIDRLLQVIDLHTTQLLESLDDFDCPYIEFIDNLDGFMTNPRLFGRYVLPSYQKYADILHSQGKKLGSHTDGNLHNLVPLMVESGLDVCESFTPAPMTDCTLEEALNYWSDGPLVWGGIPSYYLEERFPEEKLYKYIHSLMEMVADKLIILGIADAVMSDNQIDRVQWIARRIQGESYNDQTHMAWMDKPRKCG